MVEVHFALRTDQKKQILQSKDLWTCGCLFKVSV